MDNEITFGPVPPNVEALHSDLHRECAELKRKLAQSQADLTEEMSLRAKDVHELKKAITREMACRSIIEQDLNEIIDYKKKQIENLLDLLADFRKSHPNPPPLFPPSELCPASV